MKKPLPSCLCQTSLAQLENLVEAKDDGEKIFLQVGRTLDSVVNVLVLAISSVGAKFLAEDVNEKVEGSDQKSSYNPRNLSLCGNVGVEEEDLLSQEEAEEGFQAQRNSPGLLSSHIWRNSDQSRGSLLFSARRPPTTTTAWTMFVSNFPNLRKSDCSQKALWILRKNQKRRTVLPGPIKKDRGK